MCNSCLGFHSKLGQLAVNELLVTVDFVPDTSNSPTLGLQGVILSARYTTNPAVKSEITLIRIMSITTCLKFSIVIDFD